MARRRTAFSLYRIIKHLSMEEFQMLHVYAHSYHKNTLTWQLIAYLWHQPDFDRKALNARFEGSDLYSLIQYTYDYLITAISRLGLYPLGDILHAPGEIEIALQRGGEEGILQIIEERLEDVMQAELFEQAIQLCMQYKRVITQCVDPGIADLEAWDQRIRDLRQAQQQCWELTCLYENQLTLLQAQRIRGESASAEALYRLQEQPLLQPGIQLLSVRAAILQATLREFVATLTEDYAAAEDQARQAMEMYASLPRLVEEQGKKYYSLIARLAGFACHRGDMPALATCMETFSRLDYRNPMTRRMAFDAHMSIWLKWILADRSAETWEVFFQFSHQHESTLKDFCGSGRRALHACFLAVVCLRHGEMPRARYWLREWEYLTGEYDPGFLRVVAALAEYVFYVRQYDFLAAQRHYQNVRRTLERRGLLSPMVQELFTLARKAAASVERNVSFAEAGRAELNRIWAACPAEMQEDPFLLRDCLEILWQQD